ncbi:MAG: helicase C-terminal domain-containing protein [Myxococcota bacterium]
MGSRILPAAADDLRQAIKESGGMEVFAIGDTDGRSVTSVTITCRGQADRVVALLDRPRAGQVVIHNHPSGDLTPSDADMQLAGRYGENGVGVVIVDNRVESANWVVEPYVEQLHALDPARVREVFERALPTVMPGFEPRPQQIEMALHVTRCLNGARPLVIEAGTGTGKSLAYLVPAALWALLNDKKVVISTFTRTLQNQLLQSDVPVLSRAGLDVRVQLLQGRNNYLCRRRLGIAREEDPEEALFDTLAGWSDTTSDGSRLDLPVDVDAVTWERVHSDSELTLRARCPHFGTCHWYGALRQAAAAHVVIVNHALLLADLSLRSDIGRGILPAFDRLVLDEAHHLENAATSAASNRLTAEAVRRAVAPLVDHGKRRGALGRVARDHLRPGSRLTMQQQDELEKDLFELEGRTLSVVRAAEDALQSMAALLPEDRSPVRIDEAYGRSEDWSRWITPTLRELSIELEATAEHLGDVLATLDDAELTEAQLEPRMDLSRARRRLETQVDVLRTFVAPPDGHARWFEVASRRDPDSAAIVWAPVDMAPTLRRILWGPMRAVVATSATLAVSDSFRHWRTRTGVDAADEAQFASPFDHFHQALLALPRDLPEPNTPAYLDDTARAVVRLVQLSDGGAFVLCTSYAAVAAYATALRREPGRLVLAQGEAERSQLLARFMRNPSAVLVGTDSFWEGVSVKGQGLRLVVLPRIPFRVPTDPLHAARQEHLVARGLDPFRTYELPEAVLKLRQGYGRLIRSHTDRGVVVLLDTRVHSRSYGRTILSALPPARRVKGPSSWVEGEIRAFFRMISESITDRGPTR